MADSTPAAQQPVGGPFGGDGLVARLFKKRVVAALVKKKVPQAKAEELVAGFGNGEILQWIITHGGDVLGFVKMLLDLFAAEKP